MKFTLANSSIFRILYWQLFLTPTIVNQSKDYSKDIHFNIQLNWTLHHTPAGYMDIDLWLKSMTQLSNLCSASPANNKIIFFGVHDSNFDDRALIHM